MYTVYTGKQFLIIFIAADLGQKMFNRPRLVLDDGRAVNATFVFNIIPIRKYRMCFLIYSPFAGISKQRGGGGENLMVNFFFTRSFFGSELKLTSVSGFIYI